MNYATARPNIRSGDLLAFNHGDWKSWSGLKTEAVHIGTRSPYSHVAIAWVVGGRVFALEAVKPMTRIFPLSLLMKEGGIYLLPMNAPWRQETEEFALSHIGYAYSEVNAVIAFFRTLRDGDISECAAYVREILKCDGIDLGKRSTPDAVVLEAQKQGASILYIEP